MQDEIRRALIEVHDDDRQTIRHYIAWVRIRRKITDRFYRKHHWVVPAAQPFNAHWVGG